MDVSLQQERDNPWKLTLTNPVPETFEFSPSDWAENHFSSQSAKRTFWATMMSFFTRSGFPQVPPSLPGTVQRGDFREELQKKNQKRRQNWLLVTCGRSHARSTQLRGPCIGDSRGKFQTTFNE